MEYTRDNMYAALTLAMQVSPTGKEQMAFTNMYNNMQADGCTPKEVITNMVSAILDGLKHNNWPQKEGS